MKQLIILFIIALFSGIVYFLTKRLHSKIIPLLLLFTGGFLFAFFVPLSLSTIELLQKVSYNLLPAIVFLYALDFDLDKFLKNSIGCACKMGAKRYWLFVLVAGGVSFLSQTVIYLLWHNNNIVYAVLLSAIFGVVARKTPLRFVDGSEDIATTMLYLFSVMLGMQTFLVVSNP